LTSVIVNICLLTGISEREAAMKKEIGSRIEHYRSLWIKMPANGSIVTSTPAGKGKVFFARHHSFSRSDISSSTLSSECSDEMFDSVFDCLAYYRWYVIPRRLREVSGLPEETDIERLLDGSGYTTSLIAEELFKMIDICLETGQCTESDLDRIKVAYNGLSGFQDYQISRIQQWGSIESEYGRTDSAAASSVKLSQPHYIGYPAFTSSDIGYTGAFAG
jgi:hypothetical protein